MSKLKWWQFACDGWIIRTPCTATFGYQGNLDMAEIAAYRAGWAVRDMGKTHFCPDHLPADYTPSPLAGTRTGDQDHDG